MRSLLLLAVCVMATATAFSGTRNTVKHAILPVVVRVSPTNTTKKWVPAHYVYQTLKDGTMIRVWVPGYFM